MDSFDESYNSHIERLRETEFPALKGTLYLDNAGTVPYATSTVQAFAAALSGQLFGNPHSYSTVSQLSTTHIDNVRLQVLSHFNADPDHFDVVFVANATAGIKLVVDGVSAASTKAGRDFSFLYHNESHSSVVGARHLATTSRRFVSDQDVDEWISSASEKSTESPTTALFAYPAQSNLTGHRPPLSWCRSVREAYPHSPADPNSTTVYTLLDAAAFASTAGLDFQDPGDAPDFAVLSFYKIFGFPDLGALVVRKSSGSVLSQRLYFGGGTVDHIDMDRMGHRLKSDSLHSQLEDGTLPVHSIIALGVSIQQHKKLFFSFDKISAHTWSLRQTLSTGLQSRKHFNNQPVCEIYSTHPSDSVHHQGPVIAFNLLLPDGSYVSLPEVEKVAAIRNVAIRTGAMCNPGGLESIIGPELYQLSANFSATAGCLAREGEVWAGDGRALGVVRVSFGAANVMADVTRFLDWIDEFFVVPSDPATSTSQIEVMDSAETIKALTHPTDRDGDGNHTEPEYEIERLMIYPIKSCAAFTIPRAIPWTVLPAGFAWDREWCLVHDGTGEALTLKRYPQMAHIYPSIDVTTGRMYVEYRLADGSLHSSISVPLHDVTAPAASACVSSPSTLSLPTRLAFPSPRTLNANTDKEDCFVANIQEQSSDTRVRTTRVCGDVVCTLAYSDRDIAAFFSTAIGVPCRLARSSTSVGQRIWKGADGKGAAGIGIEESKKEANRAVNLESVPFRHSIDRTVSLAFPNEHPPPGDETSSISSTASSFSGLSSRSTDSSIPASGPGSEASTTSITSQQPSSLPIRLSNESPILVINRASVSSLHAKMVEMHERKAAASAEDQKKISSRLSRIRSISLPSEDEMIHRFRANIVVRPLQWSDGLGDRSDVGQHAYREDSWFSADPDTDTSLLSSTRLAIIPSKNSHRSKLCKTANRPSQQPVVLTALGPCRRCQIVCVDSQTGVRDPDGEPFSTLAKTRRQMDMEAGPGAGADAGGSLIITGSQTEPTGQRDSNGTPLQKGPNSARRKHIPGVIFGMHCTLDPTDRLDGLVPAMSDTLGRRNELLFNQNSIVERTQQNPGFTQPERSGFGDDETGLTHVKEGEIAVGDLIRIVRPDR